MRGNWDEVLAYERKQAKGSNNHSAPSNGSNRNDGDRDAPGPHGCDSVASLEALVHDPVLDVVLVAVDIQVLAYSKYARLFHNSCSSFQVSTLVFNLHSHVLVNCHFFFAHSYVFLCTCFGHVSTSSSVPTNGLSNMAFPLRNGSTWNMPSAITRTA